MTTREQFENEFGIPQKSRDIVPQNQLATVRMLAAGIAFILVLPAFGTVLVALALGSSALFLIALLIWSIFGVAHCILIYWTLEVNIANETESETILTPGSTGQMLAVEPQAALSHRDDQRDSAHPVFGNEYDISSLPRLQHADDRIH